MRTPGLAAGMMGSVTRTVSVVAVAMMMTIGSTGCCYIRGQGILAWGGLTKVGYVPASVAHDYGEDALKYPEVRRWAESVADGYDSRSTLNRHSIYIGAFIAAAAAGALAGLGAFAPGNAAITGIPIGTAFLGSVGAYYHNEDKAKLYERANSAIVALISMEDYRASPAAPQCAGEDPPTPKPEDCLRWSVEEVMRKVNDQRVLLDPEGVANELKNGLNTVKDTMETKGGLDEAGKKTLTKTMIEKLATKITDQIADSLLAVPESACCIPDGYVGPVVQQEPKKPEAAGTPPGPNK